MGALLQSILLSIPQYYSTTSGSSISSKSRRTRTATITTSCATHVAARDFLVASPEVLQRPPSLLLHLLLSIHSHSSLLSFLGWSGVSWEFNGFATFRSLNFIANRIPTSKCSLFKRRFFGDRNRPNLESIWFCSHVDRS